MAADLKGRRTIIRVQLNELLDRLRADEGQKPPDQRRSVPTIGDLAVALGISRGTLYHIAENKGRTVNLQILAAIIDELRASGFDVHPFDLFMVYESAGDA